MRLINGDELKLKLPNTYHNGFENCRECRLLEREEVNAYIDRMPTVDAAPVVHGEWISAGEFEACSVCGTTQLKTINTYYGKATKLWVKTNYCPNCGAKMDLEDEK